MLVNKYDYPDAIPLPGQETRNKPYYGEVAIDSFERHVHDPKTGIEIRTTGPETRNKPYYGEVAIDSFGRYVYDPKTGIETYIS